MLLKPSAAPSPLPESWGKSAKGLVIKDYAFSICACVLWREGGKKGTTGCDVFRGGSCCVPYSLLSEVLWETQSSIQPAARSKSFICSLHRSSCQIGICARIEECWPMTAKKTCELTKRITETADLLRRVLGMRPIRKQTSERHQ